MNALLCCLFFCAVILSVTGQFGYEPFGYGSLGYGPFGYRSYSYRPFGYGPFGYAPFGYRSYNYEPFGYRTFGNASLVNRVFGNGGLGPYLNRFFGLGGSDFPSDSGYLGLFGGHGYPEYRKSAEKMDSTANAVQNAILQGIQGVLNALIGSG